jgi:hypothetical protein
MLCDILDTQKRDLELSDQRLQIKGAYAEIRPHTESLSKWGQLFSSDSSR